MPVALLRTTWHRPRRSCFDERSCHESKAIEMVDCNGTSWRCGLARPRVRGRGRGVAHDPSRRGVDHADRVLHAVGHVGEAAVRRQHEVSGVPVETTVNPMDERFPSLDPDADPTKSFLALLAALSTSMAVWAAEPSSSTKLEVEQLLMRLGTSGCPFQRNGTAQCDSGTCAPGAEVRVLTPQAACQHNGRLHIVGCHKEQHKRQSVSGQVRRSRANAQRCVDDRSTTRSARHEA
jgi:hypothetical protein